MSRFTKYIRSIFGRSSNPTEKNPRSGTNYLEAMDYGSFTGNPLNIATAYRCAKVLCDSIAALPLNKKTRKDGVLAVTNDHLNYLLSVQPNPWTSAFDFIWGTVWQTIMKGNAYIFPIWGQTGIEKLVLATPGTVNHDVTNNTYTVMDTNQDLNGTFDEKDVIHIKNIFTDGKTGIGVIAHAMGVIGIATAGDREARKKFEDGGLAKGIVSIKNDGRSGSSVFFQNNEQSAYDAAKILNDQQKVMNISVLPGEYSFQQYSMSSAEQQFLENRKFTVLEICRFFGVHPSFVYADTASNYKSAEMANVAFLVNTLNPLLRKIENEFIRKLTGENLSYHITFEFDRTGMYACDLTSKMNYMTKLIGLGRTVNEIRLMENLPPVEGGDIPWISANLRPLTQQTQENDGNNNDQEEPLPA